MNVLRDVLLNLQRKYAFDIVVECKEVYRVGSSAFSYLDLEQQRITPSGARNRLFKEYQARGIKLFQLTSDVPAMKLRNFVISKLHLQSKIFARKCSVKECSVEEYNEILSKYHIQGAAKSNKRFGLYYNDKLVAAMGFNRTQQGWLLNRLVFSDVAVVGGASKLLAAFRLQHNGTIETFSANAYSDGGVYKALGFRSENATRSDLWYVDSFGKLLNRRKFQKAKLIDVLKEFDSSLSEVNNMRRNGYGVYYGPGTTQWILD